MRLRSSLRSNAPRVRLPGLLLFGLFFLLGSCAGTGTSSSATGSEVMVTMRDYANGRKFELAGKSHTDPVAYYSEQRDSAARKVQDDDVMDLLVKELESQGYRKFAQDGPAPSRGSASVTRSFELERGGRSTHWLIGGGSPIEERKAFNSCLEQFLGLYNISASYQTVQNPHGHEFFERSKQATPASKR